VIVDVEATRAIRQAEVGAARTMLERTETRFGMKPASLAADSAYGSADSLAWLVKEKDITPHIPVFDKSNRTDGTFSRADFAFDAERDRYTCQAGNELVQFRRTYAIPRSGVTAEGTRLYRASKLDCDTCRLKAKCCPNALPAKSRGICTKTPRRGSCARLNAGICAGLSPSKENRDAIRAPQADTAPHASAIERSERSQRRVPPCGYCPKPETTRPTKADEYASGNAGPIAPRMVAQASPNNPSNPSPKPRRAFPFGEILDSFFNDIRK
jgi:hypothetical protein